MLIEKLRAGTRQTHEELEQEMLPMIKGVADAASYSRLLHLFYGYYHPLEKGISRYIDESVLPDFAQRRKSAWILDDLTAIGLPASVKEDANAPAINNRAEALGAMFVMEGSSLGGKVICKIIADNLNNTNDDGLSFFNGYGAKTGSRWKDFLAVLDHFSDTDEEGIIIEKANEVFSKFRVWLKSQGHDNA